LGDCNPSVSYVNVYLHVYPAPIPGVLTIAERRFTMTYKNITTVAAVAAFIFGLGFIFMPAQLTGYYNVTLNEGGIFIGQLFGAALFGFGVLDWYGRHFTNEQAQQGLAIANFAGDGIGFIFALFGQLNGSTGINALGWSTVLIYLLLALGFGYLRFFAK